MVVALLAPGLAAGTMLPPREPARLRACSRENAAAAASSASYEAHSTGTVLPALSSAAPPVPLPACDPPPLL